jgi:hypothetical protein
MCISLGTLHFFRSFVADYNRFARQALLDDFAQFERVIFAALHLLSNPLRRRSLSVSPLLPFSVLLVIRILAFQTSSLLLIAQSRTGLSDCLSCLSYRFASQQ